MELSCVSTGKYRISHLGVDVLPVIGHLKKLVPLKAELTYSTCQGSNEQVGPEESCKWW